jgi:putative peptidoglycan binding protein
LKEATRGTGTHDATSREGEEVLAMGKILFERVGLVMLVSIVTAMPLTWTVSAQETKSSRIPSKIAATPEHVRELQQALAKSGYDPGPADGIMGPRTKGALRKYMSVPSPTVPTQADEIIRRFRTERREGP